MIATEQHFPVVLFIMLYKMVLTFESVDEILKCDHSNESYWAVLSYGTVLYYTVMCMLDLTVEPVHEILKCVYSGESYWAPYKVILTFKSVDKFLWRISVTIEMKVLSSFLMQ